MSDFVCVSVWEVKREAEAEANEGIAILERPWDYFKMTLDEQEEALDDGLRAVRRDGTPDPRSDAEMRESFREMLQEGVGREGEEEQGD